MYSAAHSAMLQVVVYTSGPSTSVKKTHICIYDQQLILKCTYMEDDIKHWGDSEQNGLPPNPVEWTNAAGKL